MFPIVLSAGLEVMHRRFRQGRFCFLRGVTPFYHNLHRPPCHPSITSLTILDIDAALRFARLHGRNHSVRGRQGRVAFELSCREHEEEKG